jgi:NADH-quinone oxidoreductase subunit J
MSGSAIIFFIISAFTLVTALLAVTTGKIFRSAIWLLFSLIGVASLYFWMEVEFIAAVQIIIYVGGIVILIIFSIFLTQQSGSKLKKPNFKRVLFAAFAVFFGFGFTWNLIREYGFKPTPTQPFTSNISDIGEQMLSPTQHGFVLPFEVVSMLLLAAMVGCIVIAMKSQAKKENKDNGLPSQKITPTPTTEEVSA